jgi:predicted GIY-YIG superfamily endonuclease
MTNTSTHALYRFFDISGQLLYAGITMNPSRRWAKHRDEKPWWHDVANITIETHPGRKAVLTAERHAIQTERPLYNVNHNHPPAFTRTASEASLALADLFHYAVESMRQDPRMQSATAWLEAELAAVQAGGSSESFHTAAVDVAMHYLRSEA